MPSVLWGACPRTLSAASALLFATRVAAAQPDAWVELSYRVPPSCPGEARFRSEVEARLSREIAWGRGPGSRRLEVGVTEAPDGFNAELRLVSPSGAASVREFATSDCDQAIVALAVVSALSIDQAAAESPKLDTPTAAPAPASPPRSARTGRASSATQGADDPSALERSDSLESPRRFWLEAGPVVAVSHGSIPVPLFAGGVQGALSLRSGWRFELAALVGRTGVVGASAEEGRFTRFVARASACPLRYPTETALFLRACLTADVGWVAARSAEGPGVEPTTGRSAVLATGPAVHLAYVTGHLSTGLAFGTLWNVVRNRYVLRDPYRSVYESDLVDLTAHATLAAAF